MQRAGLGYEALREINPRLVYAQLSGFGYDGPYAGRGGFDLIAQGMGGIMHVTGEPDGPPTSVGLPICDLGTGMWAVQGILGALDERERTGRGQLVECSLLETAIGFSSWTSAGWLADRKEPERQGSRHRQNAPYQRMRTEDGYLMLGEVTTEEGAQEIGTRMEKVLESAGPWTGEAEMETVLTSAPTAHWVAVLDEAGVPCGPVYNYAQLFSDPQVQHRRMIVHAPDVELGEVPHIRTPIRMESGVDVRFTAPHLGQDNEALLAELGYGPEQVAALRDKRVL